MLAARAEARLMHLSVLSSRLRAIREQRQLTQAELAEQIGVHTNQVLRWENEATMPSAEALIQLSKELEVSTDWLLGLVNEPTGHISENDLTPLERKFLAASDRGDLAGMFEIALEMYRTEPPKAHVGAGAPSINTQRDTGAIKRPKKG